MSRKSSTNKQGTLARLEDIYFTQGYKAAKRYFAKHIPEAATGTYRLLKPGQGQPAQRIHTETQDGISYESFNAPALWNVPYSILCAYFEPVTIEDFIFHGGEELLVPISGEIYYHFYSNNDGSLPQRQVLKEPFRKGSIIRINSHLPHHTWTTNKDGAKAWMIFRHISDMATSISVNSDLTKDELQKDELQSASHKITLKDLQEPGRYALIAWGLAEKIHLHRVRSRMRITHLAKACGIDSSHLSRIESAATNVSLDTLVRIARLLHINLEELIAPSPWRSEDAPLKRTAGNKRQIDFHPPLKGPTDVPHFLHPIYWHIPSGCVADKFVDRVLSSWIVLEGEAFFEISADSETSEKEFLETGSVIHLRSRAPKKIQALQDTQLLQIIYSTECHCKQI